MSDSETMTAQDITAGRVVDLAPGRVLDIWDGGEAARIRLARARDYYEGRHDILRKTGLRKDGRPYNRVVTNWVRILADRHVGFLTAQGIRVTAPREADEPAAVQYAHVARANDLGALDSRQFRRALLYGWGVEIHAFDPVRGPVLTDTEPDQWVFVTDEDGATRAAVRRLDLPVGTFFGGEILDADLTLYWAYNAAELRLYRAGADGRALELLLARPHAYGVVPVTRFRATPDGREFFGHSFRTLQDAYNLALSAHLDDTETDIDALLALYGVQPQQFAQRNPETGRTYYEEVRELGAITFPDQESRAEFVTRSLGFEKVDFTLRTLRANLHTESAAPDLDEIVGTSGATSGIALCLKFQAMIEVAGEFSKYIQASLRERIALLNRIWRLQGRPVLNDYDVTVPLNPPANETEIWQNIGALEPLLSRLDRLRLIPSVADPHAALDAKMAEEGAKSEG
jgi:hypothetical protein